MLASQSARATLHGIREQERRKFSHHVIRSTRLAQGMLTSRDFDLVFGLEEHELLRETADPCLFAIAQLQFVSAAMRMGAQCHE